MFNESAFNHFYVRECILSMTGNTEANFQSDGFFFRAKYNFIISRKNIAFANNFKV